jgi:hypothetical protein
MTQATIGDSMRPEYRFDWGDHSRTTSELGDFEEAGLEASLEDVVSVARDDPECEVTLLGFEDT